MTMTETSSASLSAWQARSVHQLTLPSGQVVRIRIPGISTLLEHGDLPDHLFDIAFAELTDTITIQGIDGLNLIPGSIQWVAKADSKENRLERVRAYGEFLRHLVAAALVEPELTFDQVTEAVMEATLPEDDLSMISEIVQRLRFRDARGVRIGVEPLDRWASFREGHRGISCTGDEDCDGCRKVIDQFSSIDVGDL